jgi:hypothetical protein
MKLMIAHGSVLPGWLQRKCKLQIATIGWHCPIILLGPVTEDTCCLARATDRLDTILLACWEEGPLAAITTSWLPLFPTPDFSAPQAWCSQKGQCTFLRVI